jgi:hypothetical protein
MERRTREAVRAVQVRRREEMEVPLEMVRAGLHWSRRMSKQMLPLELMLGWYMRVVKLTFGGLNG